MASKNTKKTKKLDSNSRLVYSSLVITMKFPLIVFVFMGIGTAAFANDSKSEIEMLVRISEIEVYPEYLNDYIKFAKEVAEISVKKRKRSCGNLSHDAD